MTEPDYGVRPCCVPDCERIIPRNHELPVCRDCGIRIAVVHMNEATRLHAVRAEAGRQREEQRKRVRNGQTRTACVYYVELAPNRIKIGFTSDLQQRMRDLRAPVGSLLALEPGGRDVERQRHVLFAGDRIGRFEEFVHSDRLARHINALREVHALPDWAKVVDTTTITRRQA